MLITIAIPCYNSTRTLPALVERIREEFQKYSEYDYQLILVNDGSPDGTTFDVISSLCSEDNKIVGIDLSKNFGQASAKMAAIPYVEGDVLVYMDDDGQHDPAGVFQLVKAVENGADMAIAAFEHKQHTFFKKVTSWLNSEMLRIAINKPRELKTSSFAAYSGFLIDCLKQYDSPNVSMFAFILQNTDKIVNVSIPHKERMEGKSGYTLKKLFRLWTDGIYSYSMLPLDLVRSIGIINVLIGFVFFFCGIVRSVRVGFLWEPMILGCMFLLTGILMICLYIVGIYLGKIYFAQNKKPQYVIRTVLNKREWKDEFRKN